MAPCSYSAKKQTCFHQWNWGKNQTDFLIKNAYSRSSGCMLQGWINPSPEANCVASTPLWSEGSGGEWLDLCYLYWFVRFAVIKIWRLCRKQWTTTHWTAMVHAFVNFRFHTAFLGNHYHQHQYAGNIHRRLHTKRTWKNSSPGQLACRALIEENSKNVCSAPIWTGAMGLVSPEGGSRAWLFYKAWRWLANFEDVWNSAEISSKRLFDVFQPIFGVVILDQIFQGDWKHQPAIALAHNRALPVGRFSKHLGLGWNWLGASEYISRNRNNYKIKNNNIGCFWMYFIHL